MDEVERSLYEVISGVSILPIKKQRFYFKHFSFWDYFENQRSFYDYYSQAILDGLETEKQLLDAAISSERWNDAKEAEIKDSEWLIKAYEKQKSKIVDPRNQAQIDNKIKDERARIKEVLSEKKSIVQFSAENFAENKKSYDLIGGSLFLDPEFKKSVPKEDVHIIVSPFYSKINHLNSEELCTRMAYKNIFFELYCIYATEPSRIFDKSAMQLTFFQKNLISLASCILKKLQNVKIPSDIIGDPIKILKYEEKKEESFSSQDMEIEKLLQENTVRK